MSHNPAQIGKTALVTGASRGIGREIALRLSEDGFNIVVNYSGNAAKAREVVDAIRRSGREALAVQGDVSRPEDVERLFSASAEAFGAPHVVVHRAGVMSLAPVSPDHLCVFDDIMQVNLRGAFLVLGEAARQVPDGGRIIALSTSVIAKSFPGYGPYIASKAGVEGLVKVLANELLGREITVNAVAPGPVATELFLEGKSDEQVAQLSKSAPLERLGRSDDIARVVSFLAGEEGGWINAQVVRANGGFA
ncbi:MULTISPECIES: SDR family oxidoreductase [Lonsdalea]|uniref:3-ketoacyl-ACP reductase n=2 Tax=Lonsdalea TaxID=1082702 RepID=A0ACD1J8M3_9GAMM|nr:MULTISPECIES: SDR family oxidoreductase [Lonsdalea]OSM95672.1 3-ketoacyl-ACP reductase [Lonsdalea populi]QPQ23148.1 SDR family oxidoreductase [Lonsdalea populi]RAT10155.1 3-ketoacyl-ACP reductase [Lonsdalea quercina]RAT21634.1 3-ketoacyl-ACP reductase [Lonsdalea populi]RAT22366.1 3-ketoacyl-ACP reductase [Lonsdalea populi]